MQDGLRLKKKGKNLAKFYANKLLKKMYEIENNVPESCSPEMKF